MGNNEMRVSEQAGKLIVRHIFISYSREDSAYVRKLAQALEREGLPVWLDERIDYGDRWPRVIEEHIDNCGAFVLVMSSHAKRSDWVEKELARALQKKKEIFPLLLEGDEWLEVQTLQHADVTGGVMPPPAFYKRLARAASPASRLKKKAADPLPIIARFRHAKAQDGLRLDDTTVELFLDEQLLGKGGLYNGFDFTTATLAGAHRFEMRYEVPFDLLWRSHNYPARKQVVREEPNPWQIVPDLVTTRKQPPEIEVPSGNPLEIVLPDVRECLIDIAWHYEKHLFVISSIGDATN